MALLSIQNVTLGYEHQTIAEHISFEVNSGDYLCIIGENGSGKSTLMKTILGLIPMISGNIQRSQGLKASEFGYLPQQTAIQKDFPASVEEIVRTGCLNQRGFRPFYNQREKEMARMNMEKIGIQSLRSRRYSELSGGQQQRVLLARALCAAEKVLFLDEPVTGLDPKVTKEMYDLIENLNRDGKTIIMISHDLEGALRYASHILHIGPHKMFYGSKDAYVSSSCYVKSAKRKGQLINELA